MTLCPPTSPKPSHLAQQPSGMLTLAGQQQHERFVAIRNSSAPQQPHMSSADSHRMEQAVGRRVPCSPGPHSRALTQQLPEERTHTGDTHTRALESAGSGSLLLRHKPGAKRCWHCPVPSAPFGLRGTEASAALPENHSDVGQLWSAARRRAGTRERCSAPRAFATVTIFSDSHATAEQRTGLWLQPLRYLLRDSSD